VAWSAFFSAGTRRNIKKKITPKEKITTEKKLYNHQEMRTRARTKKNGKRAFFFRIVPDPICSG